MRSWPASCRPPSRSSSSRCAISRPGRPPPSLRRCRCGRSAAPSIGRFPGRCAAGSGKRPETRPESKGIEIAAPEGTPVQALHDGVVAFADPFAGFGNLVILDHGAQTFSLYGDLLEIGVKRGTRVERGQPVGTVGSAPTGSPGLYLEVRVDGRAVDPLQWLKKRRRCWVLMCGCPCGSVLVPCRTRTRYTCTLHAAPCPLHR